MDNELILFDRLEVIRKTIEKYGIDNFYLSFSGGKDSTVVSALLDLAIPDNKIPRVFINTGIEYSKIVEFVKEKASQDDRFILLKPTKNIKEILEKYGYPFKSKSHSHFLAIYQKSGLGTAVNNYLKGYERYNIFKCPEKLKYQFTDSFDIKISEKCCFKLKKEPIAKWQKANNKPITMTGMRGAEGGARSLITCIITDKDKNLVKFHPLAPTTDEWENWFIDKYQVKLCDLYYPPYNFTRTGCKGCPYSLTLQKDLETMEQYLPNERRQCEIIWKPIYEEYRRINYRLKKAEERKLF